VEACFVAGPAVAAGVAWFAGASGVFVLMALTALAGAVAAGRLPSVVRSGPGADPSRPPHRVPTMVGVLVGTVAAGMGLGVLDATFPAFAVRLGTRAAVGGAFVTLMALGSGASGLLLGARVARGEDVGRRAALLLLLFGVVVLPMAAAPNVAVMVVLAFVAGAPFALMTTSASVLIQRRVAPERTTEAFSLLNAGLLTGDAIGSAAASAFVGPAGARVTLLLAGAGPVLGAAVLLAAITVTRRRTAVATPA
jgi:MFS family permease